jgi:hypothetical protein
MRPPAARKPLRQAAEALYHPVKTLGMTLQEPSLGHMESGLS